MRRNTRPPMLLTRVRTKLVIPSATGYVASHAISKYSGTLAFSKSVASIIAAYSESGKRPTTNIIYSILKRKKIRILFESGSAISMDCYSKTMLPFEYEIFDLHVDSGIVPLMRRVNQTKHPVPLMYSNNRNIFMWRENTSANLNIK